MPDISLIEKRVVGVFRRRLFRRRLFEPAEIQALPAPTPRRRDGDAGGARFRGPRVAA